MTPEELLEQHPRPWRFVEKEPRTRIEARGQIIDGNDRPVLCLFDADKLEAIFCLLDDRVKQPPRPEVEIE